jgi:hypothetical protein
MIACSVLRLIPPVCWSVCWPDDVGLMVLA